MKPLKYALVSVFLLLLAGLALTVWMRPSHTFSVVQHGGKLDFHITVPGENLGSDPDSRTTVWISYAITGTQEGKAGEITGMVPMDSSVGIPPGSTHVEIATRFIRPRLVARVNRYLEHHWKVFVLHRWDSQATLVYHEELSLPLTPVKAGSP